MFAIKHSKLPKYYGEDCSWNIVNILLFFYVKFLET